MKRFKIHWSMRWTIRVVYGLVILALLAYLGLGLFIKSNLAGDLLVDQLSSVTGHPVKVGEVSMDWLRGFHLILKRVEVPAKTGKPWLTCQRLVTTLDIWPFLTERKIVFKRLSVEKGMVRLIRRKDGSWNGIFPAPAPRPSKGTEITSPPKEPEEKITLLFPEIALRDVGADISFETEKGMKCVKISIDKGQTHFRKRVFLGEMSGNLRTCEKARPVNFNVRVHYSLNPTSPFDATLKLTGLSFEDLEAFIGGSRPWKLRGVSDIFVNMEGVLEKSIEVHGSVAIHRPFFTQPSWGVKVAEENLFFQINGGFHVSQTARYAAFLKLNFSALPLVIQRKNGNRLHLVFQGLTLKGNYEPETEQVDLSLDTHISSEAKKRISEQGAFKIKGSVSLKGKHPYDVSFAYDKFPLREVLEFYRKTSSYPVLESEAPGSRRRFPLHVLDKVWGEVRGEIDGEENLIHSTSLGIKRKRMRVKVRTSAFSLEGLSPVRFEFEGFEIPSTFLKDTPWLLRRIPPKYRVWCKAVEKGVFKEFKGEVSIHRGTKKGLERFELRKGGLKISDLSLVLPSSGIAIGDLQLDLTYRAPRLTLSSLQCTLDRENQIRVNTLTVDDVFRHPFRLKGDLVFQSSGLNLRLGEGSGPLGDFIVSKLPHPLPFIPEYFEGKISARFDGDLKPFSYKTYKVSLDEVKLKGIVRKTSSFPMFPVTLIVTGQLRPDKVSVEEASLVTPMGGAFVSGSMVRDAEGEITVNAFCNGDVILKDGELSKFLPALKFIHLSGVAPFSLKAQGTWPKTFFEGHIGATELSIGYRDLFLKEKGMASFIDLQVNQTGQQSFKVSWIRAKFGEFIVKLWGDIVSLSPLRGKLQCQTDTKQFKALLPLFPRLCKDKECLIAKGEIQCDGEVDLKPSLDYKVTLDLDRVVLPLPKLTEPIKIPHATIVFGNLERSVDIQGISYKASNGRLLSLKGTHKEGQWFWDANADLNTLDLDEFMPLIWPREGKPKEISVHEDKVGPFVQLVRFFHNKYVQGIISIGEIKIFDYRLQDFYMVMSHRGTRGDVRGLNFLTPEGYGAIDIDWIETNKGIILKVRPLVKNLDFGKILTGLLRRDSPFTGWLSFHGELKGTGKSFHDVRRDVSGYLVVKFKDGVIKHWKVLSDIFGFLDIYDILKGLPSFDQEGLAYKKIKGTIIVKNGIAKSENAYLESRPFYIAGQGELKLWNGMLSLIIGVYPFKMIDKFISKVPILGRIFTDKNKRFFGYFFKVEGYVTRLNVSSVNLESYGKNILNTFKKIITLPFYPFMNHPQKEEKK